jgi:hypothetical protein
MAMALLREEALPRRLAQMDRDRLRRYRENLDFYNGLQWPASSRFRRDRRLTLNYARVAVDKVTSYLMSEVGFAVDPPAGGGVAAAEAAARAEEALYGVYHQNDLAMLDFDTELDTAILGDGAYKIVYDTSAGPVRVTAPDVQGLFAWWRGDDPSQVWRVASRYALAAEDVADLYGFRPSAKSATVVEAWTEGDFTKYVPPVPCPARTPAGAPSRARGRASGRPRWARLSRAA